MNLRKQLFTPIQRSPQLAAFFAVSCLLLLAGAWLLLYDANQQAIVAEREKLQFAARELAADQLSVLDRARQFLIGLGNDSRLLEPTDPRCSETLKIARAMYGSRFGHFWVYLPNGDLTCGTMAVANAVNVADRAAFRAALDRTDVVTGEMQVGRVSGVLNLPLYLALRDTSGKLKSVVSIGIEMASFSAALANARLDRSGRVGLVGPTGAMIARAPDPDAWAGKDASSTEMFAALKSVDGDGVVIAPGLDGQQRVFAFVPSVELLNGRMTLYFSEDIAEIARPIEARFRFLAVASLAAILAVFVLLWLGNQFLVMRPLARLSSVAKKLGEGDFSARSSIADAPAGFTGLAQSFDRMAESLGTLDATMRANRALRVLVAEKRVPFDTGSEQEMLDAICRCIIEAGGYCGAWVGRAENDDYGSITPIASALFSLPELASLKLSWREGELGNSAVARAIRSGQAVTISDMREAPGYQAWGDLARERGVASTIALPLVEDKRVAGALVIYAAETGAFGEAETQLLAEVAGDIDRSIAARRERAARLQAEKARDETATKLLEAQRIADLGSWEFDRITNELRGSEELTRIFEWSVDAYRRGVDAMFDSVHPEDRKRVEQDWQDSLKTGLPCSSTHRLLMPDGRIKYVQQHCQTKFAPDGTALMSWGTVQNITHLYEVQSALSERMKEIRCLYDVFRATESDDRPLDDLLQSVVALLPSALRFPERAAARIRFAGKDYVTPGFCETDWMIASQFNAAELEGEVCVAYLDGAPMIAAPVFLPEERDLVAAIAERVLETIERNRLLARVRDREAIFSAIVDQAKDAVVLIDSETRRFVEFNAAAHRELGYTREEFSGMRLDDIRGGQNEEAIARDVATMMKAGGATIEARHLRKNGEMREVRKSARPITVGGRTYLAAIWSDITESKLAAAELRRINRELRAIAQAMRVIVFAKEETQLLADLCNSIIESGGYQMAWVGYALQDEEKSVKAMAHAGFGVDYAEGIKVTWKDEPLGRGPTGQAIRECRPVSARFIRTDPIFAPWREAALQHGYASSISLPILIQDQRAGGALTIYSAAPDAFDEAEFEHLTTMADALSFGIFALRERSARAEAQEAVQATAARLAHLLESSPIIVYSLRKSGDDFLAYQVSDNLVRLLGYTSEEALASGWWQRNVHPDDLEAANAAELALIEAGVGGSHDYRFALKSGGYVWIRDQLRIVRDASGQAVEVIGAWMDITAQKEAEAEIRRLSDVVEQSPNSIVITDLEGNIEYVNEAFVKQYGFSREEVMGRNPRFLNSESMSPDGFKEMWRTLLAGGTWQGEMENRRKDGSVCAINQSIIPLREADGKISKYVALGEDITERKQNEDQLRQLYLAVEQSPESIVITDLAGRIEYVNQAFTRHSGYSRDEVLGKNSRLLQSGNTPQSSYREMWAKLTRGDPWEGEFINRRKDGSEFVEFATIAPVRQPDGRVTHYLAIKDDITVRKRMERELADYRHHLEEVVSSRTAELAEARQRAEAANNAKSAFLANMSHEIRTPMNAITGLTYLLLQSVTSSEQRQRLQRIEASSRHLLALIDGILDLSKIEAGKMALENEPFDLRAVLGEAAETAAGRARDKGIPVVREFDKNLPPVVTGDALRVRQVLLNLGGNAVKFTDKGSITFRARQAGESIRFEVCDTGIGLNNEQKQRLFQPFEQADTSTTRKYGGTGLGLAICRRLVELMGGTIGVDSEVGAGSTFWFMLPLQPAGGNYSLPPRDTRTASGKSGRPSLNVLVVEDDPVNQEVACELLASAGHTTVVAGNGAIALERAAQTRFDLVLMDMQMPVMDGLAAARALRKRAEYEAVPIIAMTANAFAEDRAKCLAAGMNDFVAKPVDPAKLYECIARWLPAADSAKASAAADIPDAGQGQASRLRGIGSLDVDAGLASVAGQWATYTRLLGMYCDHHANDALRIGECIANGDMESAKRIAHTLKGVAAMLGAQAVGEIARDIDTAFRAPSPDMDSVRASVARLEETNRELVAALRSALSGSEAVRLAPADLQRARVLVAQCEQLLAEDDIRCVGLFRDNALLLSGALGHVADEIGQHVARFDFVGALALLRAAGKMASLHTPAVSR